MKPPFFCIPPPDPICAPSWNFRFRLWMSIASVFLCCLWERHGGWVLLLLVVVLFFVFVLGLCGCTWAFSSCGEWGLLSSCGVWASRCSGFSCCGAQALGVQDQQPWLLCSRAQAQSLRLTGLVGPQHVESSWTRDQTHVPWPLDHQGSPWSWFWAEPVTAA